MLVVRIDEKLELARKPSTPRTEAKMYRVYDATIKDYVFGPDTLKACQDWRKNEVRKRNLKNFVASGGR